MAIVDDHESVTLGVRLVVEPEPDLAVIGAYPDVPTLLASGTRPEIVVLSLRLGDGSTAAGNVAALRRAGIRVLVHTSGHDAQALREAAAAGASRVVLKSAPVAELVSAMRDIAADRRPLALVEPPASAVPQAAAPTEAAPTAPAPSAVPPPLLRPVPSADSPADAPADRSVGLSPRETTVLRMYASGDKAVKVANALGISVQTVNDYVRRIRAKYRAAGRLADTKIDLFRRAVEDGVIEL